MHKTLRDSCAGCRYGQMQQTRHAIAQKLNIRRFRPARQVAYAVPSGDPSGAVPGTPAPAASVSTATPPEALPLQPEALRSNEYLQSLERALPSSREQEDRDLVRLVGVCASVAGLALATELNKGWIADHQELAMSAVFLAGYVGIIVEESLGLSKAAVALLMSAALWSIRATAEGLEALDVEMTSALGEVSAIIFFLLGAMAVVEVVDSHQGFKVITQSIRPRTRTQLLLAVSTLTFFMSAVLDNLTTTIVMVALLNKLCPDPEARRFLGGVVVVAANAGGAWTPIGDVTTTMLWINGQISAIATMQGLFLPSLVSVVVPVTAWALTAPEMSASKPLHPATGQPGPSPLLPAPGAPLHAASPTTTTAVTTTTTIPAAAAAASAEDQDATPPRSNLVLSVGLGSLLAVPLLRAWTGLPPHMGMLACLGFLWLVTDAIHFGEERRHLTVSQALKRVDSEAVLFFTGVLLAVAALDRAGLLRELAEGLGRLVPQQEVIAGVIGLASAVVDNVPLVAATMGMYDMQVYPQDSSLWQLIAYCAGTGGSLLIIGSAAGVAYMGMEKGAGFGWYAKRVTPWAAVGYFAGIGTYLLQQQAVGVLSG